MSGLHGSRQVCLMQIVLTIHQPSSDICERFDDLILLSCGRMLYCGPWGDADTYFASAGFECVSTLQPLRNAKYPRPVVDLAT